MILDGLYIEDYKADVDDKEIFAFTYSNSSIAEPEAIKNNYSKSVTLKGTNNNNKIFGEIWNLDREIVDSLDLLIGASFNPKKRANFKLYDNGELLESGYICLDNITINKGVIAYSITLFGSLGDFFYNLMYNEDEGEKSLADLKLGLDNEPEKAKDTFIKWDSKYINDSWDKLKGEFVEQDKSPLNWITAAPTYSGLYDDFDNDKVLVNIDSLDTTLFPNDITKDGKHYYPADGYGMCVLQREFSEWETRDLRSLYQRPAFRTKLALDAIANPENNGGYEVVFDEEIKNSPYYSKSFIVTPRLEWEDGYTNTTDVYITESETEFSGYPKTFWVKNKSGGNTFDLSNTENANLQLTLKERIYLDTEEEPEKIYTCRFYQDSNNWLLLNGHTNIMAGFGYRVDVYANNRLHNSVGKFVTLFDKPYLYKDKNGLVLSNLRSALDLPNEFNMEQLEGAKLVKLHKNEKYWETSNFTINIPMPKSDLITIKIQKIYRPLLLKGYDEIPSWVDEDARRIVRVVYADDAFKYKFNRYLTGDRGAKDKYWINLKKDYSINDGSNYFDGISSNVQQTNVSKKQLFGNIGTPYKILTDFCKQFNLRFRIENDVTDDRNGIVHIEQRKNYFINEVEDISRLIDYSKDINIIPTTAEYKFYKFGTENEDTYAYTLYKNKYAEDYSSFTYNSSYNFNNDTKELFEDNIYNSGIDYRLNSPYFNTAKQKDDLQYPQICLTPKYEWKLWNGSESGEVTKYGLQSYFNLSKLQDFPKMCLFDKEDKEIDMTVLCFFNGFRTYDNPNENNKMPYLLTDNLPIMNNLNDSNSCFIYGAYKQGDLVLNGKVHSGDSDEGIIGHWITELPMFSPDYEKAGKLTHSFYFKKPIDGFARNVEEYNDATLLYTTYWNDYIRDLYDDNAKKVELYCFLREKPQDALRKFYFFSNSIWVLNDITDYNYRSEEPVKCTFIKVQNINNYLN